MNPYPGKPLSFIIVGSGWRAMFYVRIAKRYPELFHLNFLLCRTGEKAGRIRLEAGIPTTTSVSDCEASHPDFVVVAVSYDSNYSVAKEWLRKGYAVLAETPAASGEEALEDLWALHQKGAKLQIAEQYFRYPLIASGLRAVEQGRLGEPYAVELSLAHDYHGISLIRRMLNCGFGRKAKCQSPLPTVKLWGRQYRFKVTETDSRFGPITDGRVGESERTRISLEFENGKVAFYDFSGTQYHSFLRSRHINVQGQRGEWNDTILRCLDDSGKPVEEQIKPCFDPAYEVLHTEELLKWGQIWHPEVHMENWQDEYAIATLMVDMGELLQSGSGGYPLAEALEDAYLTLLFRQAVAHPGQVITSGPHSWQKGDGR